MVNCQMNYDQKQYSRGLEYFLRNEKITHNEYATIPE